MTGSSDIWTKESVLGGKLGSRAAWLQKGNQPRWKCFRFSGATKSTSRCLRWRCEPSGEKGSWWCQNSCWSYLAEDEQPDIRPHRFVHMDQAVATEVWDGNCFWCSNGCEGVLRGWNLLGRSSRGHGNLTILAHSLVVHSIIQHVFCWRSFGKERELHHHLFFLSRVVIFWNIPLGRIWSR